ncbi:SnoaL-like domain-containing protein [Agrobacterium larrymoorei]|uniref:ester cyclase n=1 Tax=Agrobacterium larrymoorei TaxID=160699 RepID=UPI0015745328|nr:ester cyclase [Agrobacterium larrymoorei]NTJ45085.1 SnoaL-like domain-containing protein [Agrobacterium larrymoorei]
MNDHQPRDIYLAYLDCLNRQAWHELGNFVDDEVKHNGRPFGLEGYRDMLVKDFQDIPDLSFHAEVLVCEPSKIAARLKFDCSPVGVFMALPVNGKRLVFHEHAFYEFKGKKISRVWSVIDKADIERQL